MRDVLKYGIILMVVAAFSAGALAVVYRATEEKGKEILKEERRNALIEVLPQAKKFERVKKEDEMEYFIGYESQKGKTVVGYACIAEGKGYSSTIKTMVGITSEGLIAGIKILTQQETPGLGARVNELKTSKTLRDIFRGGGEQEKKDEDKPWFQAQFVGKKTDDLYVEKMDAITGATITSRAVIDSVREKIQKMPLEFGKRDSPNLPR